MKNKKNLTPAQQRIARLSKPYNAITGADFKKLRKTQKRK